MAHQIRASITALTIAAHFACAPAMGQKPDVKEMVKKPSANVLIRTMGDRFQLPEVGSATETNLKIGDTLPMIKCVDVDGKPVDINQLFGEKATLLVFWATWCGACIQDLPHERGMADLYRDHGLKVIGVNGDEDAARAKLCADLYFIRWPTIHEPLNDEPGEGIVKTLAPKAWPTLLLFDSDRKLVAATPALRTLHTIEDESGNTYVVRGLDAALAKILRPLNYSPYLSIAP